jgi:D-proline reductase (dithiol) PrdB
MADEKLRAGVDGVPVPEFDTTAYTAPPPLRDATVAIVTSAGLHRDGDLGFRPGDQTFRVLDSGGRNLKLGHLSQNFDRVGLAADVNVVFPIDRLREMAAEGAIKAVAPQHLSFQGAQDETMTTIRLDTGPAAAKLLREAGVDVVLLTPI